MTPFRPTRRQALVAAAGLAAVPAIAADPPPAAALKPVTPAVYPFKLGRFDAVLLGDGSFTFPGVQPFFAPEGKPNEVTAALAGAFLPTDRITLSCTSLLVNTGRERVLLDAGCGSFYPGMGQLAANLRTAGVRPEEVSAVVLSHAHFDHFGGLFDPAGKSAFPNAVVYLPEAEEAYWTGPNPDVAGVAAGAEVAAQAVAAAKKFFAGLPNRAERVRPGQKLFGGALEVVAAPGHTPGMVAVVVDGGGTDQLLHIADAAHHHVLMFAHPDWSAGVDQDPTRAKATRRALFDRAAADRLRVTAAHLPFPGLGHVRPAGRAYEWVPEPWTA